MKRLAKFIALIISIGLITGCGETAKTELSDNLLGEINLSEEGSSAVCTVELEETANARYVMASKYVIFANDKGIVTRVVTVELAESDSGKALRDAKQNLEEKYSAFSRYGGATYDITLAGIRLTVEFDLDHTEVDFENMSTEDPELLEYLDKDFRFSLDTVIQMYEAVGVNCTRK